MLIPIPFTHKRDPHVIHEDMGIREWRTVFFFGLTYVGVAMQIRYQGVDWHTLMHWSCGARLASTWEWSDDHIYYDGPHCHWSRGFLRFWRDGDWDCKECNHP